MNFADYMVKSVGTVAMHAPQGGGQPQVHDLVIRTVQGTKGFWWYVEKNGRYGAWFKDSQVKPIRAHLTQKGLRLIQKKMGKKPTYWIVVGGDVLKRGLNSRKKADPVAQAKANEYGEVFLYAAINGDPLGVVQTFKKE